MVNGIEMLNAELIRDLINDSVLINNVDVRKPPGWAIHYSSTDTTKVLFNRTTKEVIICYKGWVPTETELNKLWNYFIDNISNMISSIKGNFKEKIFY